MKPIFRWAGSKRQIAECLIANFPQSFDRYIEPFCGSASLFFITEPSRALLSDINPELTTTYNTIAKSHKKLKLIVESMVDDRDYYNCIRSIDPNTLTNTERSARFIYLNRLCFNGLYRTNLKGEFNVPYSGSRTKGLEIGNTLEQAATLLRRSQVKCCDFRETLSAATKGDFVYLDPPYATSDGGFCEYASTPFTSSSLNSLLSELEQLDKKGGKFMLSYACCKEIKPFSERWKTKRIMVRRNISGFSGHRKVAQEVMIRNY